MIILKVLFIIFIIMFSLRLLGFIFLRILVNKIKKGFYNDHIEDNRKEGEITIEYLNNGSGKKSEMGEDYIDFEELK